MLLLTIFCLFVLAFANYRLASGALFYPAVVFCSTWGAALLLIWMCGKLFYPLSSETLGIFLSGAVAFSIGSALGLFPGIHERPKARSTYRVSHWILNALVLFVVVSTPFAVRWMMNEVQQHPGANFLVRASVTMLDEKIQSEPAYVWFGNVVTLSTIVAVLAFLERKNHQKRWLLSAILSLGLNVLSAGRAAIVSSILCILCIDWITTRRIRWKVVLTLALILLILAGTIAVFLGKAGATTQASFAENVSPVARGIILYAAGSLIAFDRVVRQPDITPHNWRITRFFEQRMSRIDKGYRPPSETVDFVMVGPDNAILNTYTIYFALIDFGRFGMFMIPLGLGWITTLFYRHAMQNGPIAIVMYGFLFPAIVLGLFGDYYFSALNWLLKVFFVSWCIYALPRWMSFLNQFVRARVRVLCDMGTANKPA